MITNFSLCPRGMFSYEMYVERSGSVGRLLIRLGIEARASGPWSPCAVSLSKILYPLLGTGSNQKDPSQHD